jgi:rod shape-determining protein MreD
MIMPPGKPLLLPAHPGFIWGSLVGALVLNMLFGMGWGRAAWMPDVLALTLVFWSVHQPQRVGVGAAFFFGLLMDVQQTTLLGQHALAYATLGYLAVLIHRRLLWFSVPVQTLHVLPLFALAHVLALVVRMLIGGVFPGWDTVFAPTLTAVLWPVATLLLLAPQRRPHDPDIHRPL